MSQTTRAQRLLVLVAGSLLALTTACGSDDQPAAAGSDTSASASAGASSAAPSSGSASAAPSDGAAPSTSAPAAGGATTAAPGGAGSTGGGAAGGGAGGGATAPVPGASAADPQIPVDPAKGQSFLEALRAGGLPESPLDQVNLQYAPAVCQAIDGGVPQADILAQLAGVGQYYATQTSLTADQVAQLYVNAAQQTYC